MSLVLLHAPYCGINSLQYARHSIFSMNFISVEKAI